MRRLRCRADRELVGAYQREHRGEDVDAPRDLRHVNHRRIGKDEHRERGTSIWRSLSTTCSALVFRPRRISRSFSPS